jgi:hypothetical protein
LSHDHKSQSVHGYLEQQGRYSDLSAEQIANMQADVDVEWERLLRQAAAPDAPPPPPPS